MKNVRNTTDHVAQKNKKPDKLPGVAINQGDGNKVSTRLVDERTCTLNNNPRNDK